MGLYITGRAYKRWVGGGGGVLQSAVYCIRFPGYSRSRVSTAFKFIHGHLCTMTVNLSSQFVPQIENLTENSYTNFFASPITFSLINNDPLAKAK